MTELFEQVGGIPSWPSREQFLAGLPERTRQAIELARNKPQMPSRTVSLRATDNIVIQLWQIEAVLWEHWFNTTKILEAAINVLHEKMTKTWLFNQK